MNDHSRDAIGVDISKAHLDACRLDGQAKRFANDAGGFKDFAAWVGSRTRSSWSTSPPGHYHRDFEETLVGRLRLARVNAARAHGSRRRWAAKTDAVDACVLATKG